MGVEKKREKKEENIRVGISDAGECIVHEIRRGHSR